MPARWLLVIYGFFAFDAQAASRNLILIKYLAGFDSRQEAKMSDFLRERGWTMKNRIRPLRVDVVETDLPSVGACREFGKLAFVQWCVGDSLLQPSGSTQIGDSCRSQTAVAIQKQFGPLLRKLQHISGNCSLGEVDSMPEFSDTYRESHYEGKLSPLWAQEYAGVDLAREYLQGLTTSVAEPPRVLVVDTDKNSHGPHVQTIIGSDSVFGASSGSQGIEFSPLSDKLISDAEIRQSDVVIHYGQRKERNQLPRLVNVSMTWQHSPALYDAFKAYAGDGAIVVTAAGNSFPVPVEEIKASGARDGIAIVVGSLSPVGLPSRFSQEGPVTILAPSDNLLLAQEVNGRPAPFGGTSGASPMVTGAIRNVERLIPNRLTTEDYRILLAKTAIPTVNALESGHPNGQGSLNGLLMVAVAQRLRNACLSQTSDLLVRKCVQNQIRNQETYEFSAESHLPAEFSQMFPQCASPQNRNARRSGNCSQKKSILDALRKAAFLNPREPTLWAALACAYDSEGYSVNASFYRSLVLSDGQQRLAWFESLPLKTEGRLDAIARAAVIGEPVVTQILGKFENSRDPAELSAVAAAYASRPALLNRLERLLEKTPEIYAHLNATDFEAVGAALKGRAESFLVRDFGASQPTGHEEQVFKLALENLTNISDLAIAGLKSLSPPTKTYAVLLVVRKMSPEQIYTFRNTLSGSLRKGFDKELEKIRTSNIAGFNWSELWPGREAFFKTFSAEFIP